MCKQKASQIRLLQHFANNPFLSAPVIFIVLGMAIAEVIMFLRAYALSYQNPKFGASLLSLFIFRRFLIASRPKEIYDY
ncbi:hypothetical protein H1R20_g2062, partial [Candolleomyces eurysporus]